MEQNIILKRKTKLGYATMTMTPAQFEKFGEKYVGKGKRWHVVKQADVAAD